MSFEEDLKRQLHGRAAVVRATPDLADLGSRIDRRENRMQRGERLALGAAMVVFAASVGGLAGALVRTPHGSSSSSRQSGYQPGAGPPASGARQSHDPAGPKPVYGPRTVISHALPGGLDLTVTTQSLPDPVAVTDEWTRSAACAQATVVTTSIGQDGQFGGATAVADLPALSASGLEILSSGTLQASGGGQIWWATAAVGSSVARLAAENLGGVTVAATPTSGLAVIAGPVSTSGQGASAGDMSAVVETAGGASLGSLAFVLGQGPTLVGAATTPQVPGCSPVQLPAAPSSASSSQPADPQLDAASIVAAYEQAYSFNPLLGYSANLAAVNGGAALNSPAAEKTTSSVAPFGGPVAGQPGDLVPIHQVTFVSASRAEVVYSVGGVSFTGVAELSNDGIWRVSRSTFCAAIRAGLVRADVPQNVLVACES